MKTPYVAHQHDNHVNLVSPISSVYSLVMHAHNSQNEHIKLSQSGQNLCLNSCAALHCAKESANAHTDFGRAEKGGQRAK